MIEYPNDLQPLLDKLIKNNIRPVIVGGYVRDYFLNITSKDIDIELYGIDSLEKVEKILAEFGSVNSVGKSFGVCKIKLNDLELDFSLPREDSKQGEGHRGFKITVDTSLDFKTAASRRDFTINTIGYDVINKEILDPYKGRDDLKNKILRAVDLYKFAQDPLRILRAVGFIARFNLHADQKLLQLLKKMIHANALQELPKERIFEEIKKLLLKSKHPSKGFIFLKDISGFYFFDEFLDLHNKDFTKVMQTLDRSVITTKAQTDKQKIITMLAVLTAKFSDQKQNSFLDKLTNQKTVIKGVKELTHITFDLNMISDYAIYKLATQIEIKNYIAYLLAYYEEDQEKIRYLEKRSKELGVFQKSLPPFIEGKDLIELGRKPSKEFAHILDDLYEKQMQGKFATKNEALIYIKKSLLDT